MATARVRCHAGTAGRSVGPVVDFQSLHGPRRCPQHDGGQGQQPENGARRGWRRGRRHQHADQHRGAGIGGGGSFVLDDREEWEKTFAVCWSGVYYGSRAFVPLLIASSEGHLINTSSVNGFWASLGPASAHTAYSAAKFAVKGFTEALVNDFRLNAPHVKVSLVMPGHIGTSIVINSGKILGRDPKQMSEEDVARARTQLARLGMDASGATDDEIRHGMQMLAENFRDNAPMTAAEAASVILDGVRNETWRILVGDDAVGLDKLVREDPEGAYEQAFMDRLQSEAGWAVGLG